MKKSKLRIAAIILTIISVLVFIIYIAVNCAVAELFRKNAEDGDSAEKAASAIGFIIFFLILFASGGVNVVLSGIAGIFSTVALAKRKDVGKVWASVLLMVINYAIVITVIVLTILLFVNHAS